MKRRLLSIWCMAALLFSCSFSISIAANPPALLRANVADNHYRVSEVSIPKNTLVYRYHPNSNLLEIFHHFTLTDSYCLVGPMSIDFSYDDTSGTLFLQHKEAASEPAGESGEYMHTACIVIEGDVQSMHHLVFRTLANEEFVLPLSLEQQPAGCWLNGFHGTTSISAIVGQDEPSVSVKLLDGGTVVFDLVEVNASRLVLYNTSGHRLATRSIEGKSRCELSLPNPNDTYIYALMNQRGGILFSGKVSARN